MFHLTLKYSYWYINRAYGAVDTTPSRWHHLTSLLRVSDSANIEKYIASRGSYPYSRGYRQKVPKWLVSLGTKFYPPPHFFHNGRRRSIFRRAREVSHYFYNRRNCSPCLRALAALYGSRETFVSLIPFFSQSTSAAAKLFAVSFPLLLSRRSWKIQHSTKAQYPKRCLHFCTVS